jgi:competence protein ComEC
MNGSNTIKVYWRKYLILVLAVSNLLVWVAVSRAGADKFLSVSFFDVGQGDAILIESPSHGRVLIDGGRNKKILTELDKSVGFGKRRIDVVIGTHPDADHIGGLPEVISRYEVGLYVSPGVKVAKSIDQELLRRLEERAVPQLIAERGMVINFGDGAKLIILFPVGDVSRWDANDASIVAKLVYGEKSFLLTADSPIRIEQMLLGLNREILGSDILKVGHHGSRTSTSLQFAEAVSPEYAIIQAGKNNSYGHPHVEVLDNLASVGAMVLNNAERGTIRFQTDGRILRQK